MGYDGSNIRERIVDAAERMVIETGAGHLTFEAVMTHARSDLRIEDISEDIR